MRARAQQANLETKKANEILLSFKKLDAQRELEADAAIEGVLCCFVLCVSCCASLSCAALGVLHCDKLCCTVLGCVLRWASCAMLCCSSPAVLSSDLC